jgi:hypothetical protein
MNIANIFFNQQNYTESKINCLKAKDYFEKNNSFASAVDWVNVTKSNVSNSFATWNVNNAGRGSYVYHNGSAGTGFGASNIINSGQAVFVQTIGANPSLTFTEASKVSSTPPSHFKKSLSDVLNIDIFIGDRAYDALTVLFDKENNNEYDVNDFIKLVNPEINFYSYLADRTKLAMNNMKEVGEETVVPLGLNGVFNGGSYELKFSNQNTFSNAEVKLKDKFINKLYDLLSGCGRSLSHSWTHVLFFAQKLISSSFVKDGHFVFLCRIILRSRQSKLCIHLLSI